MAAQRVREYPYTCGRGKGYVTVARGEVRERRESVNMTRNEAQRDRCEADAGLLNDNVYGSIREQK